MSSCAAPPTYVILRGPTYVILRGPTYVILRGPTYVILRGPPMSSCAQSQDPGEVRAIASEILRLRAE